MILHPTPRMERSLALPMRKFSLVSNGNPLRASRPQFG